MRNFIKFILASAIVSMMACKKDENPYQPLSISYPTDPSDGINLFTLPDSFYLSGFSYDMAVQLGNGATFKAVLTNLPPEDPNCGFQSIWAYTGAKGWIVTPYDFNGKSQQVFVAETGEHTYLQMIFMNFGCEGHCRLDMYENADTITHTKFFWW